MWTPRQHLGELDRLFAEMEKRFDFLREIDTQITNSAQPFEVRLKRLVNEFALRLIRADSVGLCFPAKHGYSVEVLGSHNADEDLTGPVNEAIRTGVEPGKVAFRRISKRVRENTAALVLPIKAPDGGIFSVVVALTTHVSAPYSHLRDDDVVRYAERVLSQFDVFAAAEMTNRKNLLQTKFVQSFFDSGLDQEKTLTKCLEAILEALPTWQHNDASRSQILIQLLSYHGPNNPLTIEAQLHKSNNTKTSIIETDIGKPVLIGDSVCGTLVREFLKDPAVRLRNIDPSSKDYGTLYKGFAGRTTPKSELMTTIVNSRELVGVLNLEHPDPNYFTPGYELAATHAATELAPFLKELNQTIELDRKRQMATLYTMFGFLERLSNQFKHKTGQLLPQIGKQRRDLKDLIDKNDSKAAQVKLGELAKTIEQFADRAKMFMTAAPHYIARGETSVRQIILGAISEVEGYDDRITYDFQCKGDPKVYASPMFQEHIFDLLNNSVDAIQIRLNQREIDAGIVRIEVTTVPVKDAKEALTGGERVRIEIVDNGTGADDAILPRIGEYKFTTKGSRGTGYGVAAARDYVRSLAGELDKRNRVGEKGFVIEMFLEAFDSTRHGEEKIGSQAE